MGFLYHEMIQYNGDPTNNLGILIVGKKKPWIPADQIRKTYGIPGTENRKNIWKNQGSMY